MSPLVDESVPAAQNAQNFPHKSGVNHGDGATGEDGGVDEGPVINVQGENYFHLRFPPLPAATHERESGHEPVHHTLFRYFLPLGVGWPLRPHREPVKLGDFGFRSEGRFVTEDNILPWTDDLRDSATPQIFTPFHAHTTSGVQAGYDPRSRTINFHAGWPTGVAMGFPLGSTYTALEVDKVKQHVENEQKVYLAKTEDNPARHYAIVTGCEKAPVGGMTIFRGLSQPAAFSLQPSPDDSYEFNYATPSAEGWDVRGSASAPDDAHTFLVKLLTLTRRPPKGFEFLRRRRRGRTDKADRFNAATPSDAYRPSNKRHEGSGGCLSGILPWTRPYSLSSLLALESHEDYGLMLDPAYIMNLHMLIVTPKAQLAMTHMDEWLPIVQKHGFTTIDNFVHLMLTEYSIVRSSKLVYLSKKTAAV
ncbi:hypothetical protein HMN09_01402500 [Mycena chlorophos]|uniref:Uncharacterized protein n=1 Tax=Mycena chlorophos TaxID=658473 RepID=A0A8H6RWS5_MYCCL|nr:hypothetical protein HMN09_01402500 [Mycena chlorophos]